jgi:hypothetical protein
LIKSFDLRLSTLKVLVKYYEHDAPEPVQKCNIESSGTKKTEQIGKDGRAKKQTKKQSDHKNKGIS